jgi:NAD(P)-dependent dehydrogenase (short-subunit alcohol dehydrogenase family)
MGHILVTGSSRGIGRAALDALAARGAKVIGHGSRAVMIGTGEVPIIAADFGDPQAAQGLWELALDVADGAIDAVVNNAGRFEANRLDRSDIEWLDAWEDTLRVNLTAAAQLSRFAVTPGFTDTSMAGDYLASRGGPGLLADIPLGRVATPEEIAAIIAFCALDAPPSMTGAVIDANGASFVR